AVIIAVAVRRVIAVPVGVRTVAVIIVRIVTVIGIPVEERKTKSADNNGLVATPIAAAPVATTPVATTPVTATPITAAPITTSPPITAAPVAVCPLYAPTECRSPSGERVSASRRH